MYDRKVTARCREKMAKQNVRRLCQAPGPYIPSHVTGTGRKINSKASDTAGLGEKIVKR